MKIGMLGYGKFGQALGGLLEEGGHAFTAYDPVAPVPPENRAASLEALVAGADFLALAVPVGVLPEALDRVAPLVGPGQVVFDVASVKVLPARWMDERLKGAPHVGVHPLFGPVSLARAERPLRTVVCAAQGHEAAAGRVAALFRGLGCLVLEQTAEEHDRLMASTHAITFFLAKGLLETGAGADLPFAPPSFHAIQRTLDAVREDASHLFTAIQNLNPYAGDARTRLLEALRAVDAGLAQTGGAAPPELLALPDLGEKSTALQATRGMIDDLDRELVELLARRAELSRRAGRAKAVLGAPVLDPGREASLLRDRRAWAQAADLEPDVAEEVFQAILRASRRVQGPG